MYIEWITKLLMEKLNFDAGEYLCHLIDHHPDHDKIDEDFKKNEIWFSDLLTNLEVESERIGFEVGFDLASILYNQKPYFKVLDYDLLDHFDLK